MKKVIKNVFTSNGFFRLATLCGAVANVLCIIVRLSMGNEGAMDFSYAMKCLFEEVCILVLFISYNNHSKNIMKGILGALLTVNLLTSIDLLPMMMGSTVDFAISIAFFILSLLMFVNHFIINSNRYSSPKIVFFNQIVSTLLVIIPGVLWGVVGIIYDHSMLSVIAQIVDVLGFSGMIVVIACVEARLDSYRLDRESAGWTEEQGYPDGYVHEYEKEQL